ncbi:MAG: transporter permease [Subtercola sp.]|jgi:ABC-type nitrate/sulfonate/bicarbonate transport system permease component|nr:transporter permease [Subtercola sp.]
MIGPYNSEVDDVSFALKRVLPPVLVIVFILAIWQVLTVTKVFSETQFPTMTSTMAALGNALVSPILWQAVGATLEGWIVGLIIASVLALIVGSLLASSTLAFRASAATIEVFKSIPAVAILPIVILVLGSTMNMKIFLISFGVFWPLLIQVIYGVRSMDPTVRDTAKILGVRGVRRFLVVTMPSAAPYIATGLRIASIGALILAVVAELVGGAAGIGRNILIAENGGSAQYALMYAYIIVAGFLGIILTGLFTLIETRVMHWHESQRNARSNEESAK